MYTVVNDRYAASPCEVESWEAFVAMCRECFGPEFVEPKHADTGEGNIKTLEANGWELTLVKGSIG